MPTIAVFGATGRVGAATVRRLGRAGASVRAVVRTDPAGVRIEGAASVVRADLLDPASIAAAVAGCDKAQVICPLPPRADDPAARMAAVTDALVAGLSAAPAVEILAVSDYGAELPSGTGITGPFHRLEARLGELPNPLTFVRSAEHMHNWARQVPETVRTGRLASMHQPLTKRFPTVHAPDVGVLTADLLLAPGADSPRVVHIEGPRRHTALDVAAALTAITGTDITPFEPPRPAWESALTTAGATPAMAGLITELFDAHNAGRIGTPPGADVRYGTTSLADGLAAALAR
ncbi:NAD(P)H-binding protein [Actinacidiphila alni]|uniref:NAD(P)H-binding protein n=1 Tax=Actinacidiphila alni TaxID=380248 RepID=UPI0033C6C2DE